MVIIAFFLTRYLWYPSILFYVDGGTQGITILALVEMVLGPILTFVAYSPAKQARKMKMDFSIIALVQIGFYASGLYVIEKEKPIAVALTTNGFYTANEVSYDFFGVDNHYLQDIEGNIPKLLFIARQNYSADDPLARLRNTPERFNKNITTPLARDIVSSKERGLKIEQLKEQNPGKTLVAEVVWAQNQSKYPQARFYKIFGKFTSGYCLFDSESQRFISFISIE